MQGSTRILVALNGNFELKKSLEKEKQNKKKHVNGQVAFLEI